MKTSTRPCVLGLAFLFLGHIGTHEALAATPTGPNEGEPTLPDPLGRTFEQQICAGRRVDLYRYMTPTEQAEANAVHKAACQRMKIPYVPPLASTGALRSDTRKDYRERLAQAQKICSGYRGDYIKRLYQTFTPKQKTDLENVDRMQCENQGMKYVAPDMTPKSSAK